MLIMSDFKQILTAELISITGLVFHKLGKDPDNYLIPITTSIADLTSMLLFASMIKLIF